MPHSSIEVAAMGSSEKFCLKWNDFQTNISASFQDLRKDQEFSDVTLACDGDTRIEAHRFILAGSSKFFSSVLKQQQHPHPLIYMRGMTAGQLSAVVDFIYHGEVNIYQEDLDCFLAVAEELQLKGLNGPETIHPEEKQSTKPQAQPSAFYTKQENKGFLQELDQTWDPLNATPITSVVPADAYIARTQTNYEELDATVNSMMEKNIEGNWECKVCGKIEIRYKNHLINHIEGKHIEGVAHPCNQCGKTLRSRKSLTMHVHRSHK
jgi:hypothetical protein